MRPRTQDVDLKSSLAQTESRQALENRLSEQNLESDESCPWGAPLSEFDLERAKQILVIAICQSPFLITQVISTPSCDCFGRHGEWKK